MNTVTDLVAHIRKHGVAKKNKFQVSIPFPQALVNAIQDQGSGALLNQFDPSGTLRQATDITGITDGRGPLSLARQMNLMCIGTKMPGTNTITTEGPWIGHDDKIAVGSNSEDVEFIFLVSGDGSEQVVLERWTNLSCNHKTGKVGYYDNYVTDRLKISQYDDFDKEQHYMSLVEAYPVTINSLDLDRTSTNEYQVISVTFAFRRVEFKGSTTILESFMDSKAVEIVDNVVAGDFVSAAQATSNVAFDIASGTYAGEALGAFDMIESVSGQLAIDPKKTKKLLSAMKGDVSSNARISQNDRDSLGALIDNIIK